MGDDLHGDILDLGLELVDPAVAFDHPRGRLEVAPDERLHGIDDRLLGDAAHLANRAAERVQLLIERLDHMARGHAQSPRSAHCVRAVTL